MHDFIREPCRKCIEWGREGWLQIQKPIYETVTLKLERQAWNGPCGKTTHWYYIGRCPRCSHSHFKPVHVETTELEMLDHKIREAEGCYDVMLGFNPSGAKG